MRGRANHNSLGVKKGEGEPNFEIKKIDRFDDRVDELWNKVKNNHCFQLERKKDYLNWRYCDLRAGKYIICQAESGDEVLGFIVLRDNMGTLDHPEGAIVDLISLPNRVDVADALIVSSLTLFEEYPLNVIKAWTTRGHPYEKMLKRRDFINTNRIYGFFEHFNFVERASDVTECTPEKFHFQMGDSDWI